MIQSAYWDDVVSLVQTSRERCEEFDPATDGAEECLREGVHPIVSLYIDASRNDVDLTQVERSLLEGALNDWLGNYADVENADFYGGFSVHEVSMAYAAEGDLERTVDRLLHLDRPETGDGGPKGSSATRSE